MKIVYQGKTKSGKEIIIRYPEIGDLENLLNFINTLSDEKTFVRNQGEHETLESERTWLTGRLKEIENKKTVHLLAFSGDELAGATKIHMLDKTEKHIGILGITVTKGFRGEGLGKLLMELIFKEAKKEISGIQMVTLEVFSTNDIARNLYKKMGFTEYGVLPNGISRDGKFEDAVLMYKNI
jgi:RimJ/RimL family protein N-acetyltransferase